jgi:hypothetical protein
MAIKLRKLVVQVDETRIEMGQVIDPPTRRAVAIAVIDNPYAGRYEAKLDALIEAGEELGALLGNKCVEALGIAPGEAQSYGKAAIVGEAGELEHAAAILHPKLGAPRSRRARRWCRRRKKWARWVPRSTCRSATKTPLSCAVTSTQSKRASRTHRVRTRSWWPSQ